jgi:squalene cyclase
MHPYPSRNGDSDAFREAAYAATHVVYTLNDYGQWRLKPEWLPHEYAFLKTRLEENIHYGDPETLGEFLDTLKSFGLDESDPSIRVGTAYLLSAQNPDGSWGDSGSRDVYQRYHSTWTAIDGLRDYAWQGQRTSFPEVLRSLMSRR